MLLGRNCGTIEAMKLSEKAKSDLNRKFQKVVKTPAGFDFFVAIHDFVEHIELNTTLSRNLLPTKKSDPKMDIMSKYNHLKQIYQGLKDAESTSKQDLGHVRYMTIQDLNRIRNKEVSDNNSFWKKRELFRKLAGEIYAKLIPDLV